MLTIKEGFPVIHENYIYIDSDRCHGKEMILHDCIANQIYLIDCALHFCFPEAHGVGQQKKRVKNWHVEQLIAAINSKKYTLEFITQYRSHYEQMWHCVIHSKKKLYYRDCQLYLPKTEATFFWNNLRPDCEW
jgi:hypothetical protein